VTFKTILQTGSGKESSLNKICIRCKVNEINSKSKSYCKPCDAERQRERHSRHGDEINRKQRQRRADDPETVRAVQRAYSNSEKGKEIDRSKKRRKRATIAKNGFEKYTEQEVIKKYGTICHICGFEIDMFASRRVGFGNWENGLHIDHLIAIARGGKDSLDNVRPSHALCNIIKGAKDFESSAQVRR